MSRIVIYFMWYTAYLEYLIQKPILLFGIKETDIECH